MTPFSSQLTCIQDLFRLAKGPSLRAIKLSPYEPNGAEFLGSALFSIASFASKLCLYAYPIYLSFQVALQRATPGAALRQAANFVTLLLSVTALSFFLRGFGRYSNPNYRRFYENFLKIKGHPLYKDYIFDINYVKPDFSYTENAKVLSAKNSGLNIIYSMIARFLTDNLAIYLTYPASTDFVKNVDLPIDLHAYSLKLAGQSSSIASMDEYIIGIANNIQLNLFHFQSKMNSSRKLVVYFTGNGENALKTQRFKDFTDHGYDFVVYDRPGYGISSGKPVPQNEANSVLAVMKFVTSRLKKSFCRAFSSKLCHT
ncbi:MAG: Protein abhd16a [Marteilia pararefringens]